MDAGGLAQMTFNNNNGFNPTGALGVPGAGFASRGKATQLKRLSVASAPKVASISEDQAADPVPTPRTSRSHLLAGLRTQPKTPGAPPASAPFSQTRHELPMNAANRVGQPFSGYENGMPHSAIASSFTNAGQLYSFPEQVLAPPQVQFSSAEEWDPETAAQMMATELYLQQRQQQLQQQLLHLTSPQFQNLNLDGISSPRNVPLPNTPMTPQSGSSVYQQQMMNGSAPIVQEVPGQPGLFQVYNPMTGQVSYVMDNQRGMSNSLPLSTPAHTASPPATARSLPSRSNGYVSSPLNPTSSHPFSPAPRQISPPKQSPSPPADFDVQPLPPPSANAFRRGGSNGHKKTSSLALNSTAEVSTPDRSAPRSAIAPRVGLPQTPMTGGFGPGQNRAGEHPVRQPRGPPPLEELVTSPTTKHEGSVNFATRQRRKALFSLRKAGMERAVRPSSEVSYSGPGSPASENELNFESDHSDTASHRSGSLSGKPSMGSLRAVSIGAIGSERKMRREGSQESVSSIGSFSDKGEEKKPRKSLAALMEAEKKRTGLF